MVVLPLEPVDDGVGLGVTTSPSMIDTGVSGVMEVNSSAIKATTSHLAKASVWQCFRVVHLKQPNRACINETVYHSSISKLKLLICKRCTISCSTLWNYTFDWSLTTTGRCSSIRTTTGWYFMGHTSIFNTRWWFPTFANCRHFSTDGNFYFNLTSKKGNIEPCL